MKVSWLANQMRSVSASLKLAASKKSAWTPQNLFVTLLLIADVTPSRCSLTELEDAPSIHRVWKLLRLTHEIERGIL